VRLPSVRPFFLHRKTAHTGQPKRTCFDNGVSAARVGVVILRTPPVRCATGHGAGSTSRRAVLLGAFQAVTGVSIQCHSAAWTCLLNPFRRPTPSQRCRRQNCWSSKRTSFRHGPYPSYRSFASERRIGLYFRRVCAFSSVARSLLRDRSLHRRNSCTTS
jgi:hypothetical protein